MTKSKAPLTMIEQMVMLLVFALAAALCLQAFVKSDELSEHMEARDRAMVLCQNVAETLRHFGGDLGGAQMSTAEQLGYQCSQGFLYQEFDQDWNPVEDSVYRLEVWGIPTELPGLWKAGVSVVDDTDREPGVLFEIEVAWQEVSAHG